MTSYPGLTNTTSLPFLNRFQGRMNQLDKTGTLMSRSPPPKPAPQPRSTEQSRVQLHRRATNILQNMGQIRNENQMNIRQRLVDKKWTEPIPSNLPSPMNLSRKISAPIFTGGLAGSLADDFQRMLNKLDHLSRTQRIK